MARVLHTGFLTYSCLHCHRLLPRPQTLQFYYPAIYSVDCNYRIQRAGTSNTEERFTSHGVENDKPAESFPLGRKAGLGLCLRAGKVLSLVVTTFI
jgi:hypothetical protein